jgi:hypothetical protein
MRRLGMIALALVAVGLLIGWALLQSVRADGKPAVRLNISNAAPREVEDSVRNSIVRDYSSAWQAMETALSSNNTAPLAENFTGFALDKMNQRVKDQKQVGLKTRIIDRGHDVEAIFYSTDGSAMELRDTATIDTEILDGDTVIHSDRAQVQYFAIMTGAEDRWKVRVLESSR